MEMSLEQKLQAKGLTAPRVLPEDLEAEVLATQYHVFPGTTTTVCCITMRNGFTVTGESACASDENFDTLIGRKIAYKNAVEKMWPLLGFRLRDQLRNLKTAPMPVEEVTVADPDPTGPTKPVELGDQVHYFEQIGGNITEPMLAIVTKVLDQEHVSLSVFAPNGTVHSRGNVQLVWPWQDTPVTAFFARPK